MSIIKTNRLMLLIGIIYYGNHTEHMVTLRVAKFRVCRISAAGGTYNYQYTLNC